MRAAALLGLCVLFALGASAGCDVKDVDFGSFGAVAPTITASCGATATTLALVPNVRPVPFLLSGGNLYVVATDTPGDTTHETLWQVPLSGASPRAIAANQSRVLGLTADTDGDLVWTTGADDAGAGGALWTLGSSGPPRILARDRAVAGAIRAYGTRIYWAESGTDDAGQPFGAVVWSSLSGDDVATLQRTSADQIPTYFVFYADDIAWTTADRALDNAGEAQVVATSALFPLAAQTVLASSDGGGVGGVQSSWRGTPPYFYSAPEGIMAGYYGAPPGLFVPLDGLISEIQDDGIDLYFIDPSTGDLLAAAEQSDAGVTRQVAYGVGDSRFLVDSACVYGVDATAGDVNMVRK